MKGEQTGILGSYQNKYYVCSDVFYIWHIQAEKYAGKDTNYGKKIALSSYSHKCLELVLSCVYCSNWLLRLVLKYHQQKEKEIGKWFCVIGKQINISNLKVRLLSFLLVL